MEKVDRIEREVTVAAGIERAWEAITSAAEISRWFGDVAEVDLRAGGAARFGWSEHGQTFSAVIESVEPPTRFAFRWATLPDTPVADGPSTLVEFTLESIDDGTTVRVVESGFASLPDELHLRQLKENTSGWRAEFADLVAYLSPEV